MKNNIEKVMEEFRKRFTTLFGYEVVVADNIGMKTSEDYHLLNTRKSEEIEKWLQEKLSSLLEQERERMLDVVMTTTFHMNIDEYLPLFKRWEGGYDVPFEDVYAQAKRDITKALSTPQEQHKFPTPHHDEGCENCGGFEGEECEVPQGVKDEKNNMKYDPVILKDMQAIRCLAKIGHRLRKEAGISIRQPLQSITLKHNPFDHEI